MSKIVKVVLIGENPNSAPEGTDGEIRIEEVRLTYSDGSTEIDGNAGFEFHFIEDDNDDGLRQMVKDVAKKYKVSQKNVKFLQSWEDEGN